MTRSVAKFISFVFHPLLMPTYAIILMLNMNSYLSYSLSPELQRIVLSLIFFTTFALPMLMTFFYIQKGIVNSIYMHDASERLLPFISSAIFYFGGFYLLNQLPIPRIFSWIILSAGISIVITTIINFKWKISIHMVGVGAVCGLLFSLPFLMMIEVVWPFVVAILISGLIGTARLVSGRHTIAEISFGFLLGFAVIWLVLKYSHLLSLI